MDIINLISMGFEASSAVEIPGTELLKRPSYQRLVDSLNQKIAFKSGKDIPVVIKRTIKGKAVDFKGFFPDLVTFCLVKGKFEPEVSYFLDKYLKVGDCYFDVGAHFGIHAQQAAELVGAEGKVIAFEPIKNTVDVLRDNLQNYPHASIVEVAITDGSKESITMKDYGRAYSGWNTAQPGGEGRIKREVEKRLNPQYVAVLASSIDKWVYEQGNRSPDFMKIDVENMEKYVLEGAKRVIEDFKPVISIEAGDKGRTVEESTASCLKFLEDRGYVFFEYDAKNQALKTHEIQPTYKYTNILCLPKDKVAAIK